MSVGGGLLTAKAQRGFTSTAAISCRRALQRAGGGQRGNFGA